MSSRLPLLALSLSALGACASMPTAHDPTPVATAADRHRIEVQQTSSRMEIPVAAGETSLSPQARQELRSFASGYLRYGSGALVLSAPVGADNTNAALLLANEARLSLVDAGVSYAAVASSNYDAAGAASAPIIISFARYEAQAPACAPLYTQDLAHQSNNQPWASFGCATQANLAAMIEDPRDLLRARDEDPRDGGRRSTVFEAYRSGEPTHAERSSDERITISNAVQ